MLAWSMRSWESEPWRFPSAQVDSQDRMDQKKAWQIKVNQALKTKSVSGQGR